MPTSRTADQQSINRSQQKLNVAQQAITIEQQQQQRRRYANRVSWWDAIGRDGVSIVHIQNRAPVPMHNAYLEGVARATGAGDPQLDQVESVVMLGNIPPCHIARVDLKTSNGRKGMFLWEANSLRFEDPVDEWAITRFGSPSELPEDDPVVEKFDVYITDNDGIEPFRVAVC